MKTSDNIDIKDEWYKGRMITSAGSSVTLEAGSQVILDFLLI